MGNMFGEDWKCDVCQHTNAYNLEQCTKCNTSRISVHQDHIYDKSINLTEDMFGDDWYHHRKHHYKLHEFQLSVSYSQVITVGHVLDKIEANMLEVYRPTKYIAQRRIIDKKSFIGNHVKEVYWDDCMDQNNLNSFNTITRTKLDNVNVYCGFRYIQLLYCDHRR
eukprot:70592_1